MPPSPRARARLLLRSGRAQPGLIAPLVVTQAAEIEALPLDEFLTNPTKLAKGLTSLHQALGTDAITVSGSDVSIEHTGAAVEATSRLVATAPGEPLLVAALLGPATVAGRRECDLEQAGEHVLDVVKRFLEAGSHLIVLLEDAEPPEDWRSAVTPVFNVARFHQAVSVAVMGGAASSANVTVLPREPKEWTAPQDGTALTITAGVVPGHHSFAEVHEACRRLIGS
jgi:hypothetical protein